MRISSGAMIGVMLAAGLTGCATAPAGKPGRGQRGAVVIDGGVVQAVAAGPGVLHAYAGARGATLYVGRVRGDGTGCAQPGGRRGADLEADQRTSIALDAHEVACVRNERRRSVELLWHLHAATAPALIATRR